MGTLKNFLERTTFLGKIARRRRFKRFERDYAEWEKKGSVLPLPRFGKYRELMEYVKKFQPKIFIETGTYTGHMVYVMLDHFQEIFSIELDITMAEKAKKRFSGYRHIHIYQGESDNILPSILKELKEPCMFWLDAHYSGGATARGDLETPVMQELQCILAHPNINEHVILIDDARCFTGKNDYPALETLRHYILDIHPDWNFEVKKDIIRIYSKRLEN